MCGSASYDDDGDGVPDLQDSCPDSIIPEETERKDLKPHHAALLSDENQIEFDVGAVPAEEKKKSKKKSRKKSDKDRVRRLEETPSPYRYTIYHTRGCTCDQIFKECGYDGQYDRKDGCSPEIMDAWIQNTDGDPCLST